MDNVYHKVKHELVKVLIKSGCADQSTLAEQLNLFANEFERHLEGLNDLQDHDMISSCLKAAKNCKFYCGASAFKVSLDWQRALKFIRHCEKLCREFVDEWEWLNYKFCKDSVTTARNCASLCREYLIKMN